MSTSSLWMYRDDIVTADTDIVGYSIEALDGGIGKIDEATYDAGSSYIVVDTGPWIFGKRVMLPAGVVRGIDSKAETVHVDLTKEEIKNAPEFDAARRAAEYQNDLGDSGSGDRTTG
jgi:hypothetical protein